MRVIVPKRDRGEFGPGVKERNPRLSSRAEDRYASAVRNASVAFYRVDDDERHTGSHRLALVAHLRHGEHFFVSDIPPRVRSRDAPEGPPITPRDRLPLRRRAAEA